MTSLQTRGMGILIGDEHYPEISIVDDSALQYCLEGICYVVTAESKGLPGGKPCPCEKTRHESGNTSYFAKK